MMMHSAPFRLLMSLVFLTVGTALMAQDEAIHDEIRTMRDRAIAAFEARDAEALLAELDERIIFTAMNNETVTGKDALRDYYARMMDGAAGLVIDLQVAFETDALATLMAGGKPRLPADR
ncbi:MAG: nuclear transport factor 2 family protein [Tabrizicola sp.]|nr:nuclear transport factor 2 family protein [Tabrizicola sp.]